MDKKKIRFGLNYVETGSFIHRLNGVTKWLLFLWWLTISLSSFDLRVILALLVLGFSLLIFSRVPSRLFRPYFFFMIYLLSLNAVFIFLFSPLQGTVYLETYTEIFTFSPRYVVTKETLFYLLVVSLKYFALFPMALLFVLSTHPTEFAAGLSRIGLPYRIAYAISLTLRYIPEITKNFVHIMRSQQSRGVDITKRAPLRQRISGLIRVLIPLILSSLDRAEVISQAMELRGFGKKKKRTWYSLRKFTFSDILVLILMLGSLFFYFWFKGRLSGRFWIPWNGGR